MAATLTVNSLTRGDHVRIQFGYNPVEGIITEDRGPIGIGGRRLYTVEFDFGVEEPYKIDLPADKIQVIERN